MTDIEFINHGSILLMFSPTERGKEWVHENVEAATFWGPEENDAVVVEPRYASDIARGAQADGLTVEVIRPGCLRAG